MVNKDFHKMTIPVLSPQLKKQVNSLFIHNTKCISWENTGATDSKYLTETC